MTEHYLIAPDRIGFIKSWLLGRYEKSAREIERIEAGRMSFEQIHHRMKAGFRELRGGSCPREEIPDPADRVNLDHTFQTR